MSDFVQEITVRLKLDGEEKLAKLADGYKKAAAAAKPVVEETKKLSPEVQLIDRLLDRMGKTYERTGAVSTRSIASISVALKALEKEHGHNIAAAKRLTDAEKDIAIAASASMKEAIREHKRFNDELSRVRAQTQEWSGFGNTIGALGPQFKQVTQVVGGVFAALTAGLAVGKQLDDWLTKNVMGWQKWKDKVADAIVRAFSGIKAATSRGGVLADLDPETMAGYSQKMQKAILARSMASREARDLEMSMGAAGVTTMVQAAKMQEQLGALLKKTEAAGLGTLKTLKDNSSTITELVDVYRSSGKTVPDQIAKWAKALEAFTEKAKKAKEIKLFELPTGRSFGEGRDIALGTQFNKNVSSFEAVWGTAAEFDARMEDFENAMKAAQKPFDEATARNAKKWADAVRDSADEFREGLGDGILSFASAGGLSFGQSAADAMAKFMEAPVGKIFSEAVLTAFGGGGPTGDPAKDAARAKQNQQIGQILELAVAGISGVAANQSGAANDTETIISQIAIGASIGSIFPGLGTIIGAVVGLLVGVISAAISSTGENYSYANLGVTDGRAFFHGNDNVSPADQRDALQRFQSTIDEFYSGYLKILLKFPMEVLPNILETMDLAMHRGKDRGGDFGREKSKEFWNDFEQYLAGGLPREIANRFQAHFEAAFTGMGMSADRFKAIWADLQGMDPKKAMELLGLLADAVISFAKTLEWFSTSLNTIVGAGFDIQPGMLQRVYEEDNRSFGEQLGLDDAKLIRLGEAMNNLTGEAQIRAANELAGLMEERMNKEKEFLRLVIATIQQINDSFQASIDELTLKGMVNEDGTQDYQSQVDFLKARLEGNRSMMATAQSPEEVARYADLVRQDIMAIERLGESAGGENGEAYRLWAIDQLKIVQGEATDRLKALAQEVEDVNDAFLAAIQGFIDAFLGATGQLTPDDKVDDITRDNPDVPGPDDDDSYRQMSISLQTDSNAYLQRIATAVEQDQSVVINMPTTTTGSTFEQDVMRGRSGGL